MPDHAAPKVFISHASEDKDRFVIPLARRLRSDGVDAWLDKWEMAPGDSLVDRIFEEGIGNADVFLVVISDASVNKPWVREELNVGLVQRIEGACKLIPIVLDGASVPVALKATVWQSIGDPTDFDLEYSRVLAAIFGVTERPELGAPPAYAGAAPLPALPPSDSIVLSALVQAVIERGDLHVDGPDLHTRCESDGLDGAMVVESLHALEADGLIEDAQLMSANRVMHVKVSWPGVLTVLAATRPELGDVQHRLLAHLVNDPATSFGVQDLANLVGEPAIVVEALLVPYESRDLLDMARFLGGHVDVRNISPLLKREID